MDINTEIEEVQKKLDTSLKDAAEENQYNTFDYFKEHTGLLVTCVSASVAIMSCILHFAVGRLNYAYLEYWNIASLHANTNNQNELYLVVCALLYMLSLTLMHGLFSGTSDAFRHYNKLLSAMNQVIKSSKKRNKRLQKELSGLTKKIERLKPKQKQTPIVKEAGKKIESYNVLLKESMNAAQELKGARRELRKWVSFQIALAIIISYLIGMLFLILIKATISIEDSIRSSWIIIGIIVFDLFLYFLPAYIETRCSRKQYENGLSYEKIKELVSMEFPDFPFEKLVKNGIKTMLSDKMLKFAAGQTVLVTIILLVVISLSGTASAKQKRSFPIYTEGTTSYAIVYVGGSTVFMEEAIQQDRTIIIDTTKQRILTTDDISYDIIAFDNVSVIKMDAAPKTNHSTFSVNDIVDVIESIFDAMKSKTGGD